MKEYNGYVLLLDIDDTVAPLKVGGPDVLTVDSMGINISVPIFIAKWLRTSNEKGLSVYWCTDRPPIYGNRIENLIGFKSNGQLSFLNRNKYEWSKLSSIIDFCNDNEDKLILLADNLVDRMTKGVPLPNNLMLILPSEGTLTKKDLDKIDSIIEESKK